MAIIRQASAGIKVFCVGGTIDKIYFDAKSEYQVGAPAVEKLLAEMDLAVHFEVESLMTKDSLDMTSADRALIKKRVKDAKQNRIVITHGTDTMTDTAEQLQTILGKTVVLTGALAPAIFKNSDAVFNLGMALAAAQCCERGVYIAMNGRVFDADSVRKDRAANRFVAI